jgi:type II secretory pathway pseudopilin PulG
MSKIIMVIIIVVAGLFAYNYYTTGALSEEERQVQNLAETFRTAQRMVRQGQRSAAVGGIGNINAVSDDMDAIDQIETDLAELMDTLEEDAAIERAERLEREIEIFKDAN